MSTDDVIKSIDCKYCVVLNNNRKNDLCLYCNLKKHKVSKKSCNKCDKRVFLEQTSIDGKSDW